MGQHVGTKALNGWTVGTRAATTGGPRSVRTSSSSLLASVVDRSSCCLHSAPTIGPREGRIPFACPSCYVARVGDGWIGAARAGPAEIDDDDDVRTAAARQWQAERQQRQAGALDHSAAGCCCCTACILLLLGPALHCAPLFQKTLSKGRGRGNGDSSQTSELRPQTAACSARGGCRGRIGSGWEHEHLGLLAVAVAGLGQGSSSVRDFHGHAIRSAGACRGAHVIHLLVPAVCGWN